jgi:hypothetical protein
LPRRRRSPQGPGKEQGAESGALEIPRRTAQTRLFPGLSRSNIAVACTVAVITISVDGEGVADLSGGRICGWADGSHAIANPNSKTILIAAWVAAWLAGRTIGRPHANPRHRAMSGSDDGAIVNGVGALRPSGRAHVGRACDACSRAEFWRVTCNIWINRWTADLRARKQRAGAV